jgi:hypothetical protein
MTETNEVNRFIEELRPISEESYAEKATSLTPEV